MKWIKTELVREPLISLGVHEYRRGQARSGNFAKSCRVGKLYLPTRML